MEQYVLIGSVLEATHMSSSSNKPKHLKRYEINNHRNSEKQNNQTFHLNQYLRERKTFAFSNAKRIERRKSESILDNHKIKTKTVLKKREKIVFSMQFKKPEGCLKDFFEKKEISPKHSRDSCSRPTTSLLKPYSMSAHPDYDIKFSQIEPRNRTCLITPQTGIRKKKEHKNGKKQKKCKPVNIKKLVKEEWEEQRRKRMIQSKLGEAARKKTLLLKQSKKQEEQNKNSKTLDQSLHHSNLKYSHLSYPESKGQPLSQEEIKDYAIKIMNKYGIDSSKYFCKHFKVGEFPE